MVLVEEMMLRLCHIRQRGAWEVLRSILQGDEHRHHVYGCVCGVFILSQVWVVVIIVNTVERIGMILKWIGESCFFLWWIGAWYICPPLPLALRSSTSTCPHCIAAGSCLQDPDQLAERFIPKISHLRQICPHQHWLDLSALHIGHQFWWQICPHWGSDIAINGDEPPHQIHSYTLLFSLFHYFLYIIDPPLCTPIPTQLHTISLALAYLMDTCFMIHMFYFYS